jgi:hypothetical protein
MRKSIDGHLRKLGCRSPCLAELRRKRNSEADSSLHKRLGNLILCGGVAGCPTTLSGEIRIPRNLQFGLVVPQFWWDWQINLGSLYPTLSLRGFGICTPLANIPARGLVKEYRRRNPTKPGPKSRQIHTVSVLDSLDRSLWTLHFFLMSLFNLRVVSGFSLIILCSSCYFLVFSSFH